MNTNIYPRTNDLQTVYLNAVINNPHIKVGDYTIYNDFVNDPVQFEKNNVLYHYPVNGDRLIIGKFCSIACGAKFLFNSANHTLNSLSNYPFPIFFVEWQLDNFEQKWGSKYPYAIRSWRNNWEELTVFFDFPVEIRKIIYTTNLIENLNGKIRKYTKNKLSFPNDDALKKSVYLAITEIEKKWYQPIWNWALIFNQFITIFENRIQV